MSKEPAGNDSSGNDSSNYKPTAVSSSSSSPLSHTAEQVFKDQLHLALQSLTPAEVAAYHQTLQEAPSVVRQEESDPMAFLRTEYFHPWLAAKRIARYWKLRSKLFGSLFHALIYQTGEDAPDSVELNVLNTGFAHILPNFNSGSSILWLESYRLFMSAVPENQNRCLFYFFSIIAENPQSPESGAVMLYRPSERRIDSLEKLTDVMPLRFKAVHLFGGQAEWQKAELKPILASSFHLSAFCVILVSPFSPSV